MTEYNKKIEALLLQIKITKHRLIRKYGPDVARFWNG